MIEAGTVYGCITVFCAGERVGGRLRRATTIVKCVRQVRLAFSVQSSEEDSPARSASWFQPRYWLALTKSSNNNVPYRSAECPLLAQSGHSTTEFRCLLLGVKRTWCGLEAMSAYDPNGH